MRVNSKHWDLLLDILTEYPEMITGKFVCQNARKKATDLWQDAATRLNALGLGEKTPAKWKLAIQDWKYKVKTKVAEIKEHEKKTGGGLPSKIKLNEQEERLMSIIGWTSALGNESVPETGLKQIQPKDKVDVAIDNVQSDVGNYRSQGMQLHELGVVEEADAEQEIIVLHVESEQTPSVANKKQKTEHASKRKITDDDFNKYQNETMEVLREISMGIQNMNIELKSIADSLVKIATKYDEQ